MGGPSFECDYYIDFVQGPRTAVVSPVPDAGMTARAGGQQLPDAPVQNFVGRAVEKDFVGLGIFEGVVKEFHARDPWHQEEDLYTVLYSDGEEEDYTLSELCPILKGPEQEGEEVGDSGGE